MTRGLDVWREDARRGLRGAGVRRALLDDGDPGAAPAQFPANRQSDDAGSDDDRVPFLAHA